MIIQYMGFAVYLLLGSKWWSAKKEEIVMVLKADTSDFLTLVFYFNVNHE
jgi:hypothetical protein